MNSLTAYGKYDIYFYDYNILRYILGTLVTLTSNPSLTFGLSHEMR